MKSVMNLNNLEYIQHCFIYQLHKSINNNTSNKLPHLTKVTYGVNEYNHGSEKYLDPHFMKNLLEASDNLEELSLKIYPTVTLEEPWMNPRVLRHKLTTFPYSITDMKWNKTL